MIADSSDVACFSCLEGRGNRSLQDWHYAVLLRKIIRATLEASAECRRAVGITTINRLKASGAVQAIKHPRAVGARGSLRRDKRRPVGGGIGGIRIRQRVRGLTASFWVAYRIFGVKKALPASRQAPRV